MRNISICDFILTGGVKQYCIDGINKDIAINLTDSSYCGLIKSDVLKNSCNNEVNSRISAARVAEDERIHNQPPLIPRGNISILIIGIAPKEYVEDISTDIKLKQMFQTFHNSTNITWEMLSWPKYEYSQSFYGYNKTFLYIKKWYEREAVRYNITNFSLNVYTKGLFLIDDMEASINKTIRFQSCSPTLIDFFENVNNDKNIGRNYDAVVYVYFDAHTVFLSCAERFNKTAYVSANAFGSEDTIKTTIHELSHIFGVNDKYNLDRACNPDTGIPEPNKTPKYPQNKACVSCGYIMGNLTSSGNPKGSEANSINNDDIIICSKDAEEMTWK